MLAEQILPHDLEAERAVIGSLLIDGARFPEVAEIVGERDFYRENHALAFRAIAEVGRAGGGIDQVAVADRIKTAVADEQSRGNMRALLSVAVAETPTAVNAVYYAGIVRRLSDLRRAIALANEVAAAAYRSDADPSAIAEAVVRGGLELGRGSAGPRALRPIREHADAAFNRLSEIYERGPAEVGIPSGLSGILDHKLGGLQRGRFYVIAARTSAGKCLGRGTGIVMYDGSIRAVEDVRPGELLMGPDSKPRRVLTCAVGSGEMFEVRQRTGGVTFRANADHLLSLRHYDGQVSEISVADFLQMSAKYRKHYKAWKAGVDWPEQDLPIEPYFLGLWLGDGSSDQVGITTADAEVVDYLRDYAGRLGMRLTELHPVDRCARYSIVLRKGRRDSLHSCLRALGLLGNKHVPRSYLNGSRRQRLELLAGLIDSDGSSARRTGLEITLKSESLIRATKFLCDSLGFRTGLSPRTATIKSRGFSCRVWRLRIAGDLTEIPVRIPRKRSVRSVRPWDFRTQGIEIFPVGLDDWFGFELDGDGLFLLEDFTVTHNTTMMVQISLNVARRGGRVVYYSLEEASIDLLARMISVEMGVDWKRLNPIERSLRSIDFHNALGRVSDLPILTTDAARLTMGDIHGQAAVIGTRQPLALVVVDYLNLTDEPKLGRESRDEVIGRITRGLKRLARELDVPVIAAAQLNREVEHRSNREPLLSDLRESGNIEQDADAVILLYRPQYYVERGMAKAHEVRPSNFAGTDEDMKILLRANVAKNRVGPIGVVNLRYDPAAGSIGPWMGRGENEG